MNYLTIQPTTIRGALRNAMGMLTGAAVPSPAAAAEVLLLHILKRDRAWIYAHPGEVLSPENQSAFRELIERRASGVPTQYLTGRQEFWGLEFEVNPSVLIPRPETEHVVEAALEIVHKRLKKPAARGVSIVDVGTGSGCIALALAHELPRAEIHAVDISEDALAVARRNAERLGLAGRVEFRHSDLLGAYLAESGESRATDDGYRFDLIVSNPPYVSKSEAGLLPREVREHEPAPALFALEDGIGVARRLIEQAEQFLAPATTGPALRPVLRSRGEGGSSWSEGGPARRSLGEGGSSWSEGGWLVLELGYNQAERVESLLGKTWAEVAISKDLRGIPRVLAAQRI